MSKLKQCPFCGGKVTIEKCSQNEGMDGNHSIWIVYCIICGARITVSADSFYGLVPFTKEEAIAIWNKRYIKGGITQPEVIRCKDCEHWKNEHLCESLSRFGSFETKADFYCGYAERKINERTG